MLVRESCTYKEQAVPLGHRYRGASYGLLVSTTRFNTARTSTYSLWPNGTPETDWYGDIGQFYDSRGGTWIRRRACLISVNNRR